MVLLVIFLLRYYRFPVLVIYRSQQLLAELLGILFLLFLWSFFFLMLKEEI